MVTKEQRETAIKTASQAVFDAYASLETALLLGSVRGKYSIPEGDFTHLIGDTILGLRPRSALEQSLVSEIRLTPQIAQLVVRELKTLFDKASGLVTVPDANADLKEKLELRPSVTPGSSRPPLAAPPQYGAPATPRPVATTPGSAPQTSAPGGARPLTREELMNALGGKRTMAQDIEALRAKKDAAKDDA